MEREDINRLYDRHARELVGFFVRRTGDPQLALDLLSETFLAAFEQRDRCRARDERQAAAWVFAIAANMLSAQYRRRGSERRATERLALHVRALTEHELDVAARLAGGGGSEGAERRSSRRCVGGARDQRAGRAGARQPRTASAPPRDCQSQEEWRVTARTRDRFEDMPILAELGQALDAHFRERTAQPNSGITSAHAQRSKPRRGALPPGAGAWAAGGLRGLPVLTAALIAVAVVAVALGLIDRKSV